MRILSNILVLILSTAGNSLLCLFNVYLDYLLALCSGSVLPCQEQIPIPVILMSKPLNFLLELVQLLSGVVVVVVLEVLVALGLVQLRLYLAELGLGELQLGLDFILLCVPPVQPHLQLLNLQQHHRDQQTVAYRGVNFLKEDKRIFAENNKMFLIKIPEADT